MATTPRITAVTCYAPGESIEFPQPADFILTHANAFTSELIRLGQRLRYRGRNRKYAHWSHAGIFINADGDLIEAVGTGVQKRNISVYKDTEYCVVRLQGVSPEERAQAVRFAEYSLRKSYGWFTIAGVVCSLLLGSKFGFGVDGQQICSALVARCLERTGEIFTEEEPWHITPAGLAKHFRVDTGAGHSRGCIPGPHEEVKQKAPHHWIRRKPEGLLQKPETGELADD